MLKYILLGFLNYQSLTGYDLKTLMEGSTLHFWHAYHSQIYTTLRKLEEDGLLTSEVVADDDAKLARRIYTMTEQGRAELMAWLGDPLTDLVPKKDDLLVRVFFSGQREKTDVLEELRLQRRLHQQKLDYYKSLPPDHLFYVMTQTSETELANNMRYFMLTLEYGKRYEQLYVEWLEMSIQAIEAWS